MKPYFTSALPSILLNFLIFHGLFQVNGITCHVCESQYEEVQWSTRFHDSCTDKKHWKLEVCPEVYDSCYIHITNYTETVAGQVVNIHKVLRGCTIGDHCGEMKRPSNDKMPNIFNIYSDCYTCHTDFCNAENGSKLIYSLISFLTVSIFSFVFQYCLI